MIPLIPLQLKGNTHWHWTWAFVDSGATYSIFHSDVADRLGMDFKSGKKMMATVGDGKCMDFFLHPLTLNINEKIFTATVGFSQHLKIGFNLLGRQDIFRMFQICFSDRYHQVTFTVTP